MEFKNPYIAGEIAQMMISNQEQYVPNHVVNGKKEVLCHVGGFHGDQLFEKRACNVKWSFRIGDNKHDCIEGLETEFADWHGKVPSTRYIIYISN